MQTEGKQQGEVLEALKVSKFTPKAPRIQTGMVSSPGKLRIQARSRLWLPLLYGGAERQLRRTRTGEQI